MDATLDYGKESLHSDLASFKGSYAREPENEATGKPTEVYCKTSFVKFGMFVYHYALLILQDLSFEMRTYVEVCFPNCYQQRKQDKQNKRGSKEIKRQEEKSKNKELKQLKE